MAASSYRLIDRVAVKGRTSPIKLYEVIDADTPERRSRTLATRARLRSAMQSYFAREFKKALAIFESVSCEDPDDAVPVIFAERCVRHLSGPPPADWGGFEQLDHK